MYVISKINQHVAFLLKNLKSSMGVPFLFGSNANVHQSSIQQLLLRSAGEKRREQTLTTSEL